MKKRISHLMYRYMVRGLGVVLDRKTVPLPDKKEPIVVDEKAQLNAVLWGDPQISALSPLRSARVYSACRDIENAEGAFDALIVAGDIAEYGAWCEYRMFAHLLDSVCSKFSNIIVITGNHDVRIRNFAKQVVRFNDFLQLLPNSLRHGTERYRFSKEINGYTFIMLGADKNAFEESYLSEEQLCWLESELDKADGAKPVFVINHQPLKNTNGLPDSWLGKGDRRGSVGAQSDRLRGIFEKHGNVIYITGHLHYGVSKYNYEDCGAFKAVSLPTVGVLNHGNNTRLSQGYVMSVYQNKTVFRARCFSEGRWMENAVTNSVIEIEM